MSRLVLAVAPASCNRIEALLHEHTAGRWRRWVAIRPLQPDRAENDADLHDLAENSDTPIFASANLTSAWLQKSHDHVLRFKLDDLLAELVSWLDSNSLTWQSTVQSFKGLSGFQLGDVATWRGQFTKVDPVLGPRAAKALLAQLRIVRMSELVDYLTKGADFAYNVYFTGNDPHSGDFAMVGPLASRIDGNTLWEAMALPKDIPDGAAIRLFSDGSWSGGETDKRVKCLVTACANKAGHVRPSQTLHISAGFATNNAMSRLETRAKKVGKAGVTLEIACPNVLNVKAGPSPGLAFAEPDVNAFVDPSNPNAYFELCKRLGEMVYPNRPLGTDGIASTIGFEHSLPKAMLPFFIFGGGEVTAADGSKFGWVPLLNSKHVQRPAKNQAEHHCADCALK